MPNTIRVTMFKIGGPSSNIDKFLDLYRTLAKTAVKDSKPYILSLHAGRAHEDARSQGFNLVCKTEFKTLEDMKYYDTDCEAHKVLKGQIRDLGLEGMMCVYYEAGVVSVL